MLGDEEAGNSKEVSKVNLGGRTFTDTSLGKGKSVSCIKFHPKKPHLLALSLIDKLNFVERTDKIGKSFDSNVVITNISEETSLPPNYILRDVIVTECSFKQDQQTQSAEQDKDDFCHGFPASLPRSKSRMITPPLPSSPQMALSTVRMYECNAVM